MKQGRIYVLTAFWEYGLIKYYIFTIKNSRTKRLGSFEFRLHISFDVFSQFTDCADVFDFAVGNFYVKFVLNSH